MDTLEADTDGKILTEERRKSFPNSVVLEKRDMAKQKRNMVLNKMEMNRVCERDIADRHSIFNKSEDDKSRIVYFYTFLFSFKMMVKVFCI